MVFKESVWYLKRVCGNSKRVCGNLKRVCGI